MTKTDSDLRSCLNTLQFIRRRAARVTATLVANAQVGQKDVERGLTDICADVLRESRAPLRRLTEVGVGEDVDRLLSCMHEHYLGLMSVTKLDAAAAAADWLEVQDFTNTAAWRNNAMQLLKFATPAIAAVALAASAPHVDPRSLKFPKKDWEARQRMQDGERVCADALKAMPPQFRPFYSRQTVCGSRAWAVRSHLGRLFWSSRPCLCISPRPRVCVRLPRPC